MNTRYKFSSTYVDFTQQVTLKKKYTWKKLFQIDKYFIIFIPTLIFFRLPFMQWKQKNYGENHSGIRT